MKLILAKKISYGGIRKLDSITGIVFHYTSNNGDTARNNCLFYKNWNTREAGAHIFVGSKGRVYMSIPLDYVAWATGSNDNFNTISIELCDSVNGYTKGHIRGVRKALKYIFNKCPNIKEIKRHYDCNGKLCPKWAAEKPYLWDSFINDLKLSKLKKGELKVWK